MSKQALSPIRPIDHLVIAVHDLDAARAVYDRLGFTLTPEARHPFGTVNSLVQLNGGFLELLAVADEAATTKPEEEVFVGFNMNYLDDREGLSMLALRSDDPAADRADFARHGLPVFAPFRFERTGRGPDGAERDLAFALTFTRNARIRDAMFFTCHNERPENFWSPVYQTHANGASRIEAVTMVARDPADFHEFFYYFTGQHDMRSDSLTVTFDLGGGKLELMSPVGVRGFFGEAIERDPNPRFVALRVAVPSLDRVRAVLGENGVAFSELLGRVVVPASEACGVAVAFSEAE
ncbi:VOC family protein [Bauldia litoralis]|uniref:Glyoxalase-like domain-containing protein n=1 Tax=Bauldia litoralis TaxID=665467 RepID=A0A1G6AYP6_9HYPH|nr:VOC family protein [Bauldia litoralis]SDB13373.1 Glyoxalase-like domain-containing protein [Bauldia litoralis]